MKCAYLLLYEKDSVDSVPQMKAESIPLLFVTEGFWDLLFEMVVLSLQNAYQNQILSEKLLENTSIVSFRKFSLLRLLTIQSLLPLFRFFRFSLASLSAADFTWATLPSAPKRQSSPTSSPFFKSSCVLRPIVGFGAVRCCSS